jgi:toxin-antitoxin system PIN domain toxin
MNTGVDTNLLLAWLNASHPGHTAAKTWFTAQESNAELVLCELVLVELYGLLRNPKLWTRPLPAPEAVALIQRLREHPHWELLDYPGGLMAEVWRHAAAPAFAYRRIYDARLALTLRHHGVTEFATANVKDFEGFGFTRVWNPLLSA